jgi:hypothetical protein
MGLTTTVNEGVTESILTVSGESLRQCTTCKLQLVCPSYTPGAPCAYAIPVTIRNKNELEGVLRALVEIQTQRILMGRFGEELAGEPDVLVGIEMDRLFKMVERWRDIADGRDSLKISVDAKGQAAGMGVLSRLFGEKVGANATMLANPIDADEVIEDMGG